MNNLQKYGYIEDAILKIVPPETPRAKPIIYAEIPEFDQTTQAVYQTEPVDMGDYIYVGVEIKTIEPVDTDIEA